MVARMMALNLSLLFAAALAGITSGFGRQGLCKESPTSICQPADLSKFTGYQKFLPDEEFLRDNCDDMIEIGECLLNYERNCPDSIHIAPYELIDPEEAQELNRQLCDEDSALGKAYRGSVDCVIGLEDEIIETLKTFAREMTDFDSFVSLEMPRYLPIPFTCFAIERLVASLNSVMTEKCGEGPEEVLNSVTKLIREDCARYATETNEFAMLYAKYVLEEAEEGLIKE